MARNTQVEADHDAPPITQILARFVATHPSRGWSEAVDAADVTAVLKDGRRVHVRVDHAIGSLGKPMTDSDLEGKFHALADGVIGRDKTGALIAACWKLCEAHDVKAVIEGATP